MEKYRKKPIVVDAEIYQVGLEDGWEVRSGCGSRKFYETLEEARDNCAEVFWKGHVVPVINTLEGCMQINKGDFIITGVQGERYPYSQDIFEMTYEAVPDVNKK